MAAIRKRKQPARPTARERAFESLGRLASASYLLAGDVLAFPEDALRSLGDESQIDIAGELEALADNAARLTRLLNSRKDAFVTAQMKRLRIRADARNLKLNIGAGRFPLKRWINIDLPPAQLALNLRWGLPFRDQSVAFVFISHVLEHFYYPDEALGILREIRRVLQPGGTARVVVPDFGKWLVAYAAGDRAFFAARRKVWRMSSRGTRLEQLLLYAGAGAGAHPTYFFGHKSGYDFETLDKLLRRAGFDRIEQSQFMASRHRTLRVDGHSAVADASFQGGHYSLFVEAGVRQTSRARP